MVNRALLDPAILDSVKWDFQEEGLQDLRHEGGTANVPAVAQGVQVVDFWDENANILLKKCETTGQIFQLCLSVLRNMPRSNGPSLANLLFTLPQKTDILLPAWPVSSVNKTEASCFRPLISTKLLSLTVVFPLAAASSFKMLSQNNGIRKL